MKSQSDDRMMYLYRISIAILCFILGANLYHLYLPLTITPMHPSGDERGRTHILCVYRAYNMLYIRIVAEGQWL